MRTGGFLFPQRDCDLVEFNHVSDNLIENILVRLILLKLLSKGKVKKLSFTISSLLFIFKNVPKMRYYVFKSILNLWEILSKSLKLSGSYFSHLSNLEDLDCKTCCVFS